MTLYLDTSFLAALFIEADAFNAQATIFFADVNDAMVVSDFAATEFASVIARVTRMNVLKKTEARAIFDGFDTWRARFTDEEDAVSSDIQVAAVIIRRLDLNLRAPDAINLAIALRLDASLVTFDRRMTRNARTLGLATPAA